MNYAPRSTMCGDIATVLALVPEREAGEACGLRGLVDWLTSSPKRRSPLTAEAELGYANDLMALLAAQSPAHTEAEGLREALEKIADLGVTLEAAATASKIARAALTTHPEEES